MGENEKVNEESKQQAPDELTLLKQRADVMGIQYHPSIGIDKLKIKINEKLDSSTTEEDKPIKKAATPKETKSQIAQRLRKKANKLVRVRVTCMNPNKKALHGDFFSVSNSVIGTIKKFIPFNGEPYHIPEVLYNDLIQREFQQFKKIKDPSTGKTFMKSMLTKEYAVDKLPPLTAKELNDLKIQQARRNSTV